VFIIGSSLGGAGLGSDFATIAYKGCAIAAGRPDLAVELLEEGRTGHFSDHDAFICQMMLDRIDDLTPGPALRTGWILRDTDARSSRQGKRPPRRADRFRRGRRPGRERSLPGRATPGAVILALERGGTTDDG
jgi:hypothetical protein